ncbi:helix-turn-helix domain-containing protein [Bacteroides acidifaciens]|uniref:helix-turn-helix domain-containing protein n=1 Tax=Bacteroides acidifaciens TaxID=85831 RepID=UPI003F691A60
MHLWANQSIILKIRTLGVGTVSDRETAIWLSDARRAVLLNRLDLSSKAIGLQTEMSHVICQLLGKTFCRKARRLADSSRQWRKPIMDCTDEEVVRKAIEQDRQSVSKAGKPGRRPLARKRSDLTSSVFLSALAQDISE